jgi:hypothetical protein
MSPQLFGIGLSLALLLTTPVGSASAQQSGSPQATMRPGTDCGGQYECVEDRPLTPAEARASLGYPQVVKSQESARQEPAQIAATQPAITK